jgi:hypothetical protein
MATSMDVLVKLLMGHAVIVIQIIIYVHEIKHQYVVMDELQKYEKTVMMDHIVVTERSVVRIVNVAQLNE